MNSGRTSPTAKSSPDRSPSPRSACYRSPEKRSLPVSPPSGPTASGRRHSPRLPESGERRNIDLVLSRFAGGIRDPPPVRRELALCLDKRGFQKRKWFPVPEERQDPEIAPSDRAAAGRRRGGIGHPETSSAGTHLSCLRAAGPRWPPRSRPVIDIEAPLRPDANMTRLRSRGPDWRNLVRGVRCEARAQTARHVVEPQVGSASCRIEDAHRCPPPVS